MYSKELNEYKKLRSISFDKILSLPHTMNKEEMENCYKHVSFYTFTPCDLDDVTCEIDFMNYIVVLKRWK